MDLKIVFMLFFTALGLFSTVNMTKRQNGMTSFAWMMLTLVSLALVFTLGV
ncbi:MAG: hypothetical protein WC815_21345 [Vicinamibacterales bacterium]|jgi:hypothetical protein